MCVLIVGKGISNVAGILDGNWNMGSCPRSLIAYWTSGVTPLFLFLRVLYKSIRLSFDLAQPWLVLFAGWLDTLGFTS